MLEVDSRMTTVQLTGKGIKCPHYNSRTTGSKKAVIKRKIKLRNYSICMNIDVQIYSAGKEP